jgi:hypothetical protein
MFAPTALTTRCGACVARIVPCPGESKTRSVKPERLCDFELMLSGAVNQGLSIESGRLAVHATGADQIKSKLRDPARFECAFRLSSIAGLALRCSECL